MRPFTLDDNLTFGYGDGVFNPEQKSEPNTLWCKYARASREPESFRNECVRTAILISEQAKKLNRIPCVMLSGGMDSEVVLKAFIEARVEFKVRTFRFKNSFNTHEIAFVNAFCIAHNIETTFYDMDVHEWIVSDEAHDLFVQSQSESFGLVPHMKLMNVIWENGELPVLGNGDVYLENTDNGWMYTELEYMLAWFRHAIKNEILGAVGFFQHTPEITLSMLREPIIERLGMGQDLNANKLFDSSRYVKYRIYKKHWPELVNRPKFAGNEYVKDMFKLLANNIRKERSMTWFDKVQISYSDFRAMIEPLNNFPASNNSRTSA